MKFSFFSFYEKIKYNRRFEASYIKNLFFGLNKDQLKKIKSYKNKHKGQTGFLIANGPSLNKIDLDLLKKYPTIGMNRIYLKNFSPTYYVVEDHLLAEDNAREISTLEGSVMFIPKDLKYCVNNNNNIIYINFVRRYRSAPKFSEDFAKKCYWGCTVTFLGLQLAFFLGFKKLYIVGLDHNYTVSQGEESKNIVSESLDINHFDPNYFGPGKRFHYPYLSLMERSYKIAKENFERSNKKIFNATVGTKLDVFDKINFKRSL